MENIKFVFYVSQQIKSKQSPMLTDPFVLFCAFEVFQSTNSLNAKCKQSQRNLNSMFTE